MTSAHDFKARLDQFLVCFDAGATLRFTSGAIFAIPLTASIAAKPFWSTYFFNHCLGFDHMPRYVRDRCSNSLSNLGRGGHSWLKLSKHGRLSFLFFMHIETRDPGIMHKIPRKYYCMANEKQLAESVGAWKRKTKPTMWSIRRLYESALELFILSV